MDAVFGHDWKNDEGWQTYEKRFDFGPHFTKQKKELFLLKKKRKYYKQHIDPDYVQGETTVPHPEVKPEPKPEPQQNQSSQPESEPQPTPTSQTPPPPTETKPKKSNTTLKLLIYSYVAGHLFICFSSLLVMFGQTKFFYFALYTALAIRLSWVFYKNGRPQFNAMYAQRIFQAPDSMHALCAFSLMFSRPGFFGLISPLCHSINFGFGQLNKLLKKKIPSIQSRLEFAFTPIISRKAEISKFAPLMEVYYGVFLVGGWPLGMSGSFVSVFLYWNFLRMKFIFSTECKNAFSQVKAKVGGYVYKVPMLAPYYQKLCDFLYSYADVASMQRQYQNGASSGGLLSSLTSKCNIM